jgi:hypothetical protein
VGGWARIFGAVLSREIDRWDLMRWIGGNYARCGRKGMERPESEEEKTLVDLDRIETLVSFSDDDRPTTNAGVFRTELEPDSGQQHGPKTTLVHRKGKKCFNKVLKVLKNKCVHKVFRC